MAVDLKKLFDQIDARLASNQTLTCRKLAKELGLTIQDIENAVRDVERVAFSEYRRYRHLIRALEALKAKNSAVTSGDRTERRSQPRLTIPHIMVRYHLFGRGLTRSKFSKRCAVKDLNADGISFLGDRSLKPGRIASLLITSAASGDPLSLEGRVVYSIPANIANYRYCVGIQFAPFDAQANNNSPEDLKSLLEFVRAGASRRLDEIPRTNPDPIQ